MSLEILEKFDISDLPSGSLVLINSDTPEVIKILRLLSGSARIFDNQTATICYKSSKNFINSSHTITKNNLNQIITYVFEENCPTELEVATLFQRVKLLNKEFYEEIKCEIMLLLSSMSKSRFTEGFLYLYRVIERISVAIPLIYISKERTFRAAHSLLLSIYSDNKAPGELGMLQKFLKFYAKSNTLFKGISLDFNASSSHENLMNNLIDEMRRTIYPEVNSVSLDNESRELSVPYEDVASFIVAIRNRTFHNRGTQANINLAKLGGSEPLFRLFLPGLLTWFSYIFVEIARWQLSYEI